jgi:hypothetical protein
VPEREVLGRLMPVSLGRCTITCDLAPSAIGGRPIEARNARMSAAVARRDPGFASCQRPSARPEDLREPELVAFAAPQSQRRGDQHGAADES